MKKYVTTCDVCGDTLIIPPGTYYRGIKGHPHCLKTLEQSDITNELVSPLKEREKALIEGSLNL